MDTSMKLTLALITMLWVAVPLSPGADAQTTEVGNQSPHPVQPSKTAAAPPNSQPMSAEDAVVEEINAIRAQLGGGIAKQLEGLLDDPNQIPGGNGPAGPLQQDFEQELKKLTAAHGRPQVGTPSPPPWEMRTPQNSRPVMAAAHHLVRSTAVQAPRLVENLRNAARNLEQAAAELEYAGRFAQADQIRLQARELWLQARQPLRD